MIRTTETLLHGGTTLGGWRAKEIHATVVTAFGLTADRYGLNQLRYDLRKIKDTVCWSATANATLPAHR
jgi:hypothetical protein